MYQRAETGKLSPRSFRISKDECLPRPLGASERAAVMLEKTRREMKNAVEQTKKLQEMTGCFLQSHYSRMSEEEVFYVFFNVFHSI